MSAVFVSGIVVFVLAAFVGLEVISKVPPTLHTPLMSGANAISGITIVGAVIAAGLGRAALFHDLPPVKQRIAVRIRRVDAGRHRLPGLEPHIVGSGTVVELH